MQDTPRRCTTSAHAAHVPARLQAAWAELVRRGGLSDQKIKKGTFLSIEKLSFWESPVKIRDVAGTPNVLYRQGGSYFNESNFDDPQQSTVKC